MTTPQPAAGATVDAGVLMRLRHHVAAMPPLRLGETGRPGAHVARRRGSGLDVRDLRPYADGDDFRHVDAMATARTGRTHVRTFHDEQDRTAFLVADFRRPMLWGTRGRLRSVAAAEALALAGWRALAAGGRVGLLVLSDGASAYERPRQRDAAMARIAAALAGAHADAVARAAREAAACGPPLDARLERVFRLAPRNAAVFLATGLDDPGSGIEPALQALQRRGRLEILLVRDAFERDPPARSLPFFTTGGPLRWGAFVDRRRPMADRLDRLRDGGATIHIVDADLPAADADRR